MLMVLEIKYEIKEDVPIEDRYLIFEDKSRKLYTLKYFKTFCKFANNIIKLNLFWKGSRNYHITINF